MESAFLKGDFIKRDIIRPIKDKIAEIIKVKFKFPAAADISGPTKAAIP